jgi:hypothetical protein
MGNLDCQSVASKFEAGESVRTRVIAFPRDADALLCVQFRQRPLQDDACGFFMQRGPSRNDAFHSIGPCRPELTELAAEFKDNICRIVSCVQPRQDLVAVVHDQRRCEDMVEYGHGFAASKIDHNVVSSSCCDQPDDRGE